MGGVVAPALTVAPADVWVAYFDPVVGHEQGGRRPAIIVSSDVLHEIPSALVFVVPVTTRNLGVRAHVGIQFSEGSLPHESFAMTEQLRSFSRLRLRKRVGSVDQPTLSLIRQRILWFLDFDFARLG